MNKSKLKILVTVVVSLILVFPINSIAEQTSESGSGSQTANPDSFVEVVVNDNTINYGSLNILTQASANGRTDGSSDFVIFESENDIADSISFDEGATNSNLFSKIAYTGETYPVGTGLDNTNWLFFKDATAGTGYIESQITGTLTNGGGSVTMPGVVNEVGSYSTELIYYTTADVGATWTRNTKTVYVALGDDGNLYVDDVADLSSAEYITDKGSSTSDAFLDNNMVLSTAFPTAVDDTVTLDFGYYIDWDSTQGNADKTFYTLIDIPKHAATNHAWTWNLTISNEYHSNP